MSDLYLIAHKVRGEPAFDVATRMECPECRGEYPGCIECDGLGFWWIVPTSGHRAYPWWHSALLPTMLYGTLPEMPPSLPDHYTTHATPSRPKLAELLRVPSQPVHRRF